MVLTEYTSASTSRSWLSDQLLNKAKRPRLKDKPGLNLTALAGQHLLHAINVFMSQ
jgi:hypothetical protein